jgi:heat shock protein HslJ
MLSDGTFELTRVKQVTPAEMDAAAGGVASDAGATAGSDELAGTSWVWTETLMSDDSKSTPAQADAFQLVFGTDGSVSTTTDCNTNAGSYTVDGNQIKIDFQISTMMACPNDAQEAEYIKDLLGVQSYLFADGNLVLEFPMDAGTMTFAPAK